MGPPRAWCFRTVELLGSCRIERRIPFDWFCATTRRCWKRNSSSGWAIAYVLAPPLPREDPSLPLAVGKARMGNRRTRKEARRNMHRRRFAGVGVDIHRLSTERSFRPFDPSLHVRTLFPASFLSKHPRDGLHRPSFPPSPVPTPSVRPSLFPISFPFLSPTNPIQTRFEPEIPSNRSGMERDGNRAIGTWDAPAHHQCASSCRRRGRIAQRWRMGCAEGRREG